MFYKVTLKRVVIVDADTPDEAEEIALECEDLFESVEDEVLLVLSCGNAKYYPYGES